MKIKKKQLKPHFKIITMNNKINSITNPHKNL